MKNLVIVESPSKSKTIEKYLGKDYKVVSSKGHIRDLATTGKEGLGVDVENDFKPTYVVSKDKKDTVKELKSLVSKAEKVYLATDPDREGEAISWHLAQELGLDVDDTNRVVFNEITKNTILNSMENPRTIDMNLVRSQETRRILDRIIGFKLSKLLQKKIKSKSAGRVQSVALRMICEREDEIEAFTPVEYWTISADLTKEKATFEAELQKYKDKKIEIKNEEDSNKIIEYLNNKSTEFVVDKISNRETTRKPSPPFITSTLQREASSKLGYGVAKTMQIAQKLYEGIELGSDGAVGLITYMRTDSVRISDDAQASAKEFIINNYGEKYYPSTPNNYVKAGKKNVQDAHEAIRPSYPERTPQSLKAHLTNEQYRLYKLIWDRFMSSQMQNASISNTSIDINAGDYTFKTGTSSIIFDGFLKLYSEDEESAKKSIPEMKKGDVLKCKKINPKQHFTQPPPRYSEASLVKALEEHGIGRPSTYAPIITKIQTKGYVEKIEKALAPTLLGRTVSKQLVEHFKNIMDYEFTAGMETKLDEIAEKKATSDKVLKEFYDPFVKTVADAKQNMERISIESDVTCPNCGKKMVVRTSRFGSQFLGCSGYPECKTMMPLNAKPEDVSEPEVCEEKCEKCGSDMIYKIGPYGKYMECKECKNRKRIVVSTGVTCPKCGNGEIVQRKSKYGKIFYGCNKYPDCDFVLWNEPTGEKCPDCGSLLVKKVLKKGTFLECSSKTCKYSKEVEENV